MKARFIKLLAFSALVGVVTAILLGIAGSSYVSSLAETTDYQARCDEKRVKSLQLYVSRNGVAAIDSTLIAAWFKQEPVVLMEIYRDGKLLFNSAYYGEESLYAQELDVDLYGWYSYYPIEFSDGTAQVLIIGDDIRRLRSILTVAEIFFGVLAFLALFLRGTRKIARYIDVLRDEVLLLESGNLEHPIEVRGTDELAQLAAGLDSMRLTLREQRDAEALALKANQSLITGMSHDLRTPLTKIKLYTEILKTGKYRDREQALEFLERIDGNIEQMKLLSDGIVEYSMGAHVREEQVEKANPKEALSLPLSELAEYLTQRGFTVESHLEWPERSVTLAGPFVARLLDNIASNIDKYADHDHPVTIRTICTNDRMGIAFSNAISSPEDDADSRKIGLANAHYMMGRMNGSAEIQEEAGIFSIILWFRHNAS